jgi:hypothetical protein
MHRSVMAVGVSLAAAALALAIPPSCSGSTPANETAEADADASSDANVAEEEAPACAPATIPAALRDHLALAPFYAKVVMAGELPILSSALAPDDALCTAKAVVLRMVEHRPEILARLAEKKIRLTIMASSEVTTDVPEHADLTPKDYWDERARGLGATLARPAVSAAEENVLCHEDDRYRGESILVHELSHAILNIAIELFEPDFGVRVDEAYAAAMAESRFRNTYAGTNRDEYWAEGVQSWFDTNLTATPADGIHNEIHTRAQLKDYDPALSALVAEVFGDGAWRYACP